MSRLNTMLTSTAAKVVLGSTIAAALIATALEMHPDYSRDEWVEDSQPHRHEQGWDTFFIAIPNGTTLPKAWDTHVLGDCNLGECCIDDFCYQYKVGPLVNGYKLYDVIAPPYFADGWRRWAVDTPVVKWWWSFSDVVTACKASPEFTDVQCLNLLDGDSRCWLLDTGGCCRYGIRGCEPTTSGGNGGACPYAQVVSPMPCTSSRGAGGAMADALKVWTVEDME